MESNRCPSLTLRVSYLIFTEVARTGLVTRPRSTIPGHARRVRCEAVYEPEAIAKAPILRVRKPLSLAHASG